MARSAAPPTWSSAVLPTRAPNLAQGPKPCACAGRAALLAAPAAGRTLVVLCRAAHQVGGPCTGRSALRRRAAGRRCWRRSRRGARWWSTATRCQARHSPPPSACPASTSPGARRARARAVQLRRLPCFTLIMPYHALPSRLLVPCLSGEVQVMGGRPGEPRAALVSLHVRRAQQLCIVFNGKRGCGGRMACLCCGRVACAWAPWVPALNLPSMQLPLGVKGVKHTTELNMLG